MPDPLKAAIRDMRGYGPFGGHEGETLLFSIGNDYEAHGPALPLDIDSRSVKAVTLRLANLTGAGYCAHIPYSTDMCGEIAKYWSPYYIPFDEFSEKTLEFMRFYLKQMPRKPKKVVILNGHGGNTRLITTTERYGGELGVTVDVLLPDEGRVQLEYSGEHAYIIEHSVAAYLGLLDARRLEELNKVAAKDPLEVLRRWPSVAGLGGFQEYGGKKFSMLKVMLHEALEHFKKKKRIEADIKLGKKIFESMVSNFKTQI